MAEGEQKAHQGESPCLSDGVPRLLLGLDEEAQFLLLPSVTATRKG